MTGKVNHYGGGEGYGEVRRNKKNVFTKREEEVTHLGGDA